MRKYTPFVDLKMPRRCPTKKFKEIAFYLSFCVPFAQTEREMRFTLELVARAGKRQIATNKGEKAFLFAVQHDTVHTINRFISFN